MGPKTKAKAKQASVQYFPLLQKPASAAGKYADVPGKFWDGCPAADRAKIYRCRILHSQILNSIRGYGTPEHVMYLSSNTSVALLFEPE